MKRVFVTGASRGLGLAVCRRLIAEDWQILATARSESAELKALRLQDQDRVEWFPADLGEPDTVLALAKRAQLMERIDAFVSCAALGTESLLTLSSTAQIQACLQVNLLAPILLAREIIKGMLNHGGTLVFVSSVAARTGLAGLSTYAAAKGGLVAFSKSVAREYGPRGIRSNCVLPGFFESDMTSKLEPKDRDRIQRRTALDRLGTSVDMVGAIVFLLSDDARYITGTELIVDGGMTA